MPALARRLGTFDAALIVMGGIIGSGIFMNPHVVADHVSGAGQIMLVWAAGGLIALAGAFLFAELAARRATGGGLYAYLRDAFHPIVAFAYGWTLLLVSQSGGMAAAAVVFSNYFLPLTGLHWSPIAVAAAILAIFTIVNCMGVREGTTTQNVFMVLKIGAILALIGAGLFGPTAATAAAHFSNAVTAHPGLTAIGLALVPVLFSFSGWQTASFMTAELHEPRRTLPRGLIYGVIGVTALYLAVNAACIHMLGSAGLAASTTPASDVARAVFGPIGERVMALVVALSTLGFLSNQILVSPRVYFQMAEDGVFFKQLAWIDPRTKAPVVAIVLQAVAAVAIMLSQHYDQIINYVTCVDEIFFGLAAIALFIFRARDRASKDHPEPSFRMPGHPYTTLLFLAIVWSVVLDLLVTDPHDTLIGMAILISSVPLYFVFRRFASV